MTIELQNTILEMIARGDPLTATIEKLCREVEAMAMGVVCSVLAVEGDRLHPLAAPSLPDHYSAAIDNFKIGPLVGSCGTAAYLAIPVTVTDIENDPKWADFKALALPLGFKSCWSTPIMSGSRVVGTFAFYYREQRGPSNLEKLIVDACVHLCAIAIERDQRVRERQRLTYLDALTGLPNRASFNQALAGYAHAQTAWGILLADLDNLKVVNDTFGHSTGDELISTVGHRMASVMPPERVFRIGGDEFAIILDGVTSSDLAEQAANILDLVKVPARCNGHVVVPGMTVGGSFRTKIKAQIRPVNVPISPSTMPRKIAEANMSSSVAD